MDVPLLTAVVPVRNEEAFLGAPPGAPPRARSPADRFEVIVADGQSEDDTVAVVRRLQANHANLRLVYNPRRLSSAARNLGVRLGRGDFVLVVDGHCELRSADYL